jgi:hypothetical protein
MSQRPDLAPFGWFVASVMYFVQSWVLMKFLLEHTGNSFYYWTAIGLTGLCILLGFVVLAVACDLKGCARKDEDVSKVWAIWLAYIVIFTTSVALIFFQVAEKLEQSHWLSPNVLKSVLCITPALLVLVPQLTISRSHRKSVLSLSVFAALNIFDGIEMLEIVLMQNERKDFNLDDSLEIVIIVFVCISFIVTSVGLTRNKFVRRGNIVLRDDEDAVCYTLLEILFTNLSFLVLRIIVWVYCGYEASIFIAKNLISLGIGVVEFGIIGNC